MRKDRISVALTKDIIKTVDDHAKKEKRSRSAMIQIVLENHFHPQTSQEARTAEIPFKMG